MSKVNLSVIDNKAYDNVILVNGSRFKYKKDKNRRLVGVIDCDNECEVEIYNWNEIKCKLWLIVELFFFIISIFGIFDIRRDKKGKTISFKAKFMSKDESNVKLGFNVFKDNTPAIKIDADCEMEILENRFYIDEQVVKRYKILKICKVLTFLLVLACLFAIIIL